MLSVEQIRAWCGRPDVAVTVNPVIDLRERLECLGYEPTAKIREHVIVRDGTCVFPWCGRNARRCDLDHIVPYDHDHPDQGGPTATDNLAALCRRHHRLKTHGRWRYEMTDPGVFTWTSPLGFTYLRDHTGSRATGRAWPEPGVDEYRRRPSSTPSIRRTSDHHAPDPAPVTPAGSQARPGHCGGAGTRHRVCTAAPDAPVYWCFHAPSAPTLDTLHLPRPGAGVRVGGQAGSTSQHFSHAAVEPVSASYLPGWPGPR